MRPILAATLLFAATPACADWQNTKWGMTLDEAIKATGAFRIDKELWNGEGFRTLAHMPYEALGIPFTARLHFSNMTTRLIGVELEPIDRDRCFDVLNKLEEAYGTEARHYSSERMMQAKWRDTVHGNDIVWTRSTFLGRVDVCSVVYSEIATPAAKSGL